MNKIIKKQQRFMAVYNCISYMSHIQWGLNSTPTRKQTLILPILFPWVIVVFPTCLYKYCLASLAKCCLKISVSLCINTPQLL